MNNAAIPNLSIWVDVAVCVTGLFAVWLATHDRVDLVFSPLSSVVGRIQAALVWLSGGAILLSICGVTIRPAGVSLHKWFALLFVCILWVKAVHAIWGKQRG